MSAPITYRCAQCGWEGESEWTDEEARAEAVANGFDPDGEPMAVICDDCYQARPWFSADSTEEGQQQ